jgi:hypothetical protein
MGERAIVREGHWDEGVASGEIYRIIFCVGLLLLPLFRSSQLHNRKLRQAKKFHRKGSSFFV